MFNEITKRAVQAAFEHPKQIDENLVMHSRRARCLIVWSVTKFRRCSVARSAAAERRARAVSRPADGG
jgi:DNA topoisomerase IA